ncbi:MAG: PLP-dependent aminotransferase family protein [Solirubrobacterales bacterium]
MSNFLASFTVEPDTGKPLYQQIGEYLQQQILSRAIPAGMRLPPERKLAEALDVSRTTAIHTYHWLEQSGLVASRVGSGTYVIDLPENTQTLPGMPWDQLFRPLGKNPMVSILRDLMGMPRAEISLAGGMIDPAMYPAEAIQNVLHELSSKMCDLGYIPTEGYGPLRTSLARLMETRGAETLPENILVTAGSQQALYLAARSFLEPGDYVILESPTYIGAIQLFQALGARILALPNTKSFPLDVLEDYLTRYRPKLFYTIPSFQNPTGRVLSTVTRQEILKLGERYRLVILEDDPYSELYYAQRPPESLKALDPYGGVLYLGTLSKVLVPGLRAGWLAGPAAVINRLAQEKQYVDLHCANLSQHVTHRLLEENVLSQHLKRIRPIYARRRDALALALREHAHPHLTFDSPEGGFYFWCTLKAPITAQQLLHEAAKAGISFVPGDAFYANQYGTDQLRLCFVTHNEQDLASAARHIGEICSKLSHFEASPRIPAVSQPLR